MAPIPKRFTETELLERATLRVAMHIRGLWEERGSSDTRLLEALFIPDSLTTVGRSRTFNGKGRREHVVPRLVIIDACHEMLKSGASDETIARFIRDHVKIVQISPEECERLDRSDQLGLRQKMPNGWKPGDDVFARLEAAGIEWDLIPPS
jgi:hypothetical protein